MYIRINKKNIDIFECTSFIEKFKSFKMYFKTIDYGLLIKNKRYINTYLFCQKVDICVTNSDYEIVYLFHNVSSEYIKILNNKYNIFYLPLNTSKNLFIGGKLRIHKEKES